MPKMVDVFILELSAKNLCKVRTNDFYQETCGVGKFKIQQQRELKFHTAPHS